MLSSDTLHKVGGVALAAAAAGGLILYINRARKHMRVRVDGRESLHPFRNLSYTNLSELDKKNLKLRSSSPTHNGQEPDDNSVLSQSEHGGWVNEREEIDSTVPAKTDLLHTGHLRGGKLVICTVGLPGRGKTYMAKKVARYLRWIKYRTRVFSLAKYRLDKMGNKSSEFFNPTNNTFYEQRFESMKLALADAMSYLNHRGEIAIIDGTNVSRDRRDYIRECLSKQDGFEVLWIECRDSLDDSSPSDDSSTLSSGEQSAKHEKYLEDERQRRQQRQARAVFTGMPSWDSVADLAKSPDFIDEEDFARRIAYYKAMYEHVSEDEGSSIIYWDDGQKVTLHALRGFLMTKVISFVLNLRRRSLRPIYMCRHGGTDNTGQVVGTDFGLSEIGCNFADALNQYLATEIHQPEVSLTVWCSTAKRARTTSKHINSTRQVEWRALRDLDAGVFDGLSYERIQEQYPKEAAARKANKLNYRYPRGESYMDVISRLEPVIFELERQEGPVLIVAHQAVLRCLYSYYLDLPQEGVPYLSVPLHTLIRLEPETFGCKEKRLKFTLQQDNPLNVRGRTMSDAPPSSHG